MRVLITGVNGFIGRYVAKSFISGGAHVIGTDIHQSCYFTDIDYIQADLTSKSAPSRLANAGPYDCIVHLAASLDMHNEEVLRINPLSTLHTLYAAIASNCQLFLNLSSVPIIGLPSSEPITENTPPFPRTLYHVSKYAAENIVVLPEFSSIKRYNLRITSPVGPGMGKRFLSVMLEAANAGKPLSLFGRGTRVQNYIDVRDIAASLYNVAQVEPEEGLYLLGGESHANLDVAQMCIAATGNNSELVFQKKDDPQDTECWLIDDTKARLAFHHAPQYSLYESIVDMLRWIP